jgi:hypothetical protein
LDKPGHVTAAPLSKQRFQIASEPFNRLLGHTDTGLDVGAERIAQKLAIPRTGQRFAFRFLPTPPYDGAVAVRLTLPPDGRVENLTSTNSVKSNLQVDAPCRAHQKKDPGEYTPGVF